MFLKSRLVPLLTLLVGGLGGWAAASGQFDSLLRAESRSVRQPTEPATCPADGCCVSPDKVAAIAAINAHNEKVSANLQKDGKKPNILFIMGDDIGMWNVGAYHRGLMAGRTPNLDKLAKEGML